MGSEEKRYALLIDSDNVSAKYIDTIFDELADRGMVTVRRIYGDWARSVNGMESSNFASKFHRSDPAVRLYPG